MVKEFLIKLMNDEVEGEILKSFFFSLLTGFITLGLFYFISLKDIVNFDKYSSFLYFILISFALIIPSINQIKFYKEFPCMSGMMIGMTLGMISGFLSGFYIGASNGMFYGSLFGILFGILIGIYVGKSCGVMGVLEGVMAGFMGGIMGAMTAIMMYNDNLKLFGLISLIICAFILLCLQYMTYKESRMLEKAKNIDQFSNIVLMFILTVISIWIIVFGPRSVLFQ